ncbi:Protein of unknown function [Gryllus bimaculatus]|nr:Protein of unknown function [Gryllus bimaculatus]
MNGLGMMSHISERTMKGVSLFVDKVFACDFFSSISIQLVQS